MNNHASFEEGKITNAIRSITSKEVRLMNLISSLLIKDNDTKKTSVEGMQIKVSQDYGFNLYKALEFSRDNANKANHNLQMELICSRLV